MNQPLNTAASDVFAIFKRMTPLIQHACEGNVDEVRKLLGEDNSYEQAAVMGAVIGGHVECLKLFLPLVGQKNWELALASAAMEGKSACISLLLEHAPKKGLWHSGVEQALTDTIRFNKGACTEVLVHYIVDQTNESTYNCFSSLQWNDLLFKSVEFRNTQAFMAILPHCDPINPHGRRIFPMCLEGASRNGLTSCVQALLPFSTQWPDAKQIVHESLMKAVHKGHEEIARLLLPWTDPMHDDSVALRAALQYGDEGMAEVLYEFSDLDVVRNQLKKYPHADLTRLNELVAIRDQRQHLIDAVNDHNSGVSHRQKKM